MLDVYKRQDIDREERRLAKGRPPNGSGMENANGGVDKINDEQKRDDSQHADKAEKHAAQPAVFIGKDIPVLLVFVLKLPHVLQMCIRDRYDAYLKSLIAQTQRNYANAPISCSLNFICPLPSYKLSLIHI